LPLLPGNERGRLELFPQGSPGRLDLKSRGAATEPRQSYS